MDQRAFTAMAKALAPVVRDHVAGALKPVMERLDEVDRQFKALPAPPPDRADEIAGLREDIKALHDGPFNDEEVAEAIKAAVAQHLAENPPPPGKDGRDGLDVKRFLRIADGRLIAVMSDASTEDLGIVQGKDGAPGKDGVDGFGFDDLDIVDDGTSLWHCYARGEVEKRVRLPIPYYRGVFKQGTAYFRGNTVTFGGSTWHCDADETVQKPEGAEKHWTLMNKRGRDGKDAPAVTKGG